MAIMTRQSYRLASILLWLLATLLVAFGIWARKQGFYINHTPSMPIGLYQTLPKPWRIAHGTLILLCPPNTPIFQLAYQRRYIPPGQCKNGSEPILKPVAAMPGDWLTIRPSGISVNGKYLNRSALSPKDSKGRILPHVPFGQFHVPPGEIWLISTHFARSFDSRYFGPISIASIQAVVKPVWTWNP